MFLKQLWHILSLFSRHINKLSRSYYLKFWSTCTLPIFLHLGKLFIPKLISSTQNVTTCSFNMLQELQHGHFNKIMMK